MRTFFFRKVCERHSWNGAIDLTTERGVCNLCVQVAGGDGRPSCIWGPSAGEPVRPRELSVFSDVSPVPVKPTEAEQDEHHATSHAAHRSLCEHCVKGRGRSSPHAVVSERELPEIGVDCTSEVANVGQTDYGQF